VAENKNAIADYFTQQASTAAGLAQGEQQKEEAAARTDLRRPDTFGEQFSESVRAGAQQVKSDVAGFGAIASFIAGNEDEAQKRLNYSNRLQESYSSIIEPIGNFEEFLEQPTFDGFVDEVSKVGLVVPQAAFSLASGGTGLLAGLLGKAAVSVGSKSAAKKLLIDLQKKKLNSKKGIGPALTPEEDEILESVYQGLRAAKYTAAGQAEAAAALQASRASNIPFAKLGFWSGAFAQGEVVGASQSFQEYEDAGYELSKDEAQMALLLGIPQATLDTLGERVFFGALTKKLTGDLVSEPIVKNILKKQAAGGTLSKADQQLLQKAVGDIPAGVFLKDLGKAAASGFLLGGTQEGLVELGQEQILISQRQAIDPEYSDQQANLRRAEAAFLGFFAGAGRTAPTNVIAKAANLLGTGQEVSEDIKQQIQMLQDPDGNVVDGPVPETPQALAKQVKAVFNPNNPRTVVFIPESQDTASILNDIIDDADRDKVGGFSTEGGTVIYDKTNPLSQADAERLQKEGFDSEETLRDVLGFTEVQDPTHELVVFARDADGDIVFRQTVSNTKNAVEQAKANARRRNPGATVDVQTKEDAIKESMAVVRQVEDENDFETQQSLSETGGVDPTTGTVEGEANIEGEAISDRVPFAASEEGYLQKPVAKTNRTEEIFFPTRTERSAKVKASDLEDLDLSGNIRLNEIPKAAVTQINNLRAKYPTTNFVLERTTEESTRNPGTTIEGFKIRVEGPLDPDIKVVVEEAIKEARKALGQQFGKNAPQRRDFTVTDIEGDNDLTPVLIQSLLENKELIPDSELTGSGGSFLTGQQRLRRQFEVLVGQLALADKEILYKGERVLGFTEEMLGSIQVPTFEEGQAVRNQRLNPRAGEFSPTNLQDLQRTSDRIIDLLERNGVEDIPERTVGPIQRALLTRQTTAGPAELQQTADASLIAEERAYIDRLVQVAADNDVEVGQATGIDINPESFDPEVVSEIGVFEEERYRESKAQASGFPLSRLNMEEGEAPRTYLSQKKAEAKKVAPRGERKKVDQFSASDSVQQTLGVSLFNSYKNILTKLGMKENLRFMTVDDVLFSEDKTIVEEGKLTPVAQGLDLQKEYAIEKEDGTIGFINANDLFETQKESLRNSPASARFLRFGNQNIVLIDPNKDAGKLGSTLSKQAKQLIDMSHEVGHAFFYSYKDAIIGTPLGKILLKDFDKAKKRLEEQGSSKYSDPKTGFDEWFADQFTIWTQKTAQGEGAKNRVDSYFRTLTNNLKKFYELVSGLVYNSRFSQNQLSQTFEEFMADVGRSVEEGKTFDALTTAEKFEAAQAVEDTAKQAKKFNIDNKTINYFKNKAIQTLKAGINQEFTFLPEDKKYFSVAYILRTADAYMRSKSEELGLSLYKRSVTKEDPGYLNVRVREFQKYLNRGFDLTDASGRPLFKDASGDIDFDKFNAAHIAQEDDTISLEQLTDPAAKAIRQFKEDFFATYIGPSGIAINKRQNFSERQLNKPLIQESAEARARLVELLQQKNPDAKLNGEPVDFAKFVDRWVMSDDASVTSDVSVGVDFDRAEFFINITNKELRNAGLLIEPAAAFRAYINNAVRRVEYHKRVKTTVTEADLNNENIQGTIILPNIPIVARDSKNKGDKTKGGWAAFNREENVIYLDESELKRTFDEKAWSKPKVEGVNPLPDDRFSTLDQWRRFVIGHESAHAKFPQEPGESKAAYENRMNQVALKGIRVGEVANADVAAEIMLGRIPDALDRQGARHTLRNMLGKSGHDMSPLMRKLNSYGLLVNMVTLLPFATIASLPDLAGPMLRSKGMVSFKEYFNEFKYALKNRKEAEAFARDLGLVTHDSIHTMYVNAYELGFMDETAKAIGDGFFKGIGLDWYTKFSRTFAAGMGQRFLIKLAQENTEKSNADLKELGLTRQQIIKAYDKNSGTLDTSSPEIRDALGTFVDESILRPNAAERPSWASNPYTALIFQLKSFFYAFGVNIMGGLFREGKNAYNEKGIPGAAVPLVLAASTLLPLSIIGLELREFIKYLGRGVTPGFIEEPLRGVQVQDTFSYSTAFRTDGMPWNEYILEILDRAGIFGPATIAFSMGDNAKYGDAWLTPAFGPTAERLEDLLIDGEFRFGDIYPF
jgi:hypothetical protein